MSGLGESSDEQHLNCGMSYTVEAL